MWTPHTGGQSQKKPRLPAFLSVPVVISAIFIVPLVLFLAWLSPLSVLLGFVPIFIVFPALAWLDRVEPEPWSSRIHAVLWGAMVAALVSVIINSIVGLFSETLAVVVSAPVVEETMKGLGVIWAVRRREVDGVMDGIVYAGWVALGFAVVEDFTFFVSAEDQGVLVQTFILRATLTPFAHPLFTAWTGLAVGLAVSKQKPVLPYALWGLALAIFTHFLWNGSIALTEATGQPLVILLAIAVFVLAFFAAMAAVIQIRRKDQKAFVAMIPFLAQRYGMAPNEVANFADWAHVRAVRAQLTKPQRKRFDEVHTALARLAHLHQRPGPINPADEQVLFDQLQVARSA